jgi:signal transduction histidine kinase
MVQALLKAGDPNALPQRGLGLYPADQRYYYFTAIPIALRDKVVGVVIVGTSLDTLLPYFKAASVADVIVYREGGRAVASTFTAATLDELAIPPDLYQSRIKDDKITAGENIRVNNRWYRLARGPLRVVKDKLAVFAVVLPSNFIISAGATSRNTYALLFTAAMACVVLIGYLIAQRITHPISRLVRTSQAVAEGDLEQRTGISSPDEIGTLATTFDAMTGRLADRTRALEQLLQDYKEAAGRMRAILSSIGDGVLLEDLKGDFIPLNAAANIMLQDMAAGFLLSPLRELSEEKSTPASHVEPNPWLLEHRRFQVGKKVISVHSAAVRTDDGQRLGSVIVMRDVTAEVEAERVKDAFVAHVSHELRTPLTAVKGYSDLLLAGSVGALNDQQSSFLGTISHHTDRLIEMINGLLDFSEMEAKGRLGLQRRPILLSTLVKEIAQEWQPQMDEKGLSLQVVIPAVGCLVNADIRRLRWAIINLVRNAWQYTSSGGQVTLQLAARDGHVVLDVIDTGVGISHQDLPFLFSRFYRTQSMSDDDVRGLGLGLYVAKAIIEAHEGEIHVASEQGVGSTFSVTLPALATG